MLPQPNKLKERAGRAKASRKRALRDPALKSKVESSSHERFPMTYWILCAVALGLVTLAAHQRRNSRKTERAPEISDTVLVFVRLPESLAPMIRERPVVSSPSMAVVDVAQHNLSSTWQSHASRRTCFAPWQSPRSRALARAFANNPG